MITRLTAWARTLRVPTAEQLTQMSDDQAFEVYGISRRRRARAAVLAEMKRRDKLEADAKKRAAARFARWQRRAAYDDYVHAAWLEAELECRGYLLSRAGLAANVEPADLWSMAEPRAMRLASEELRDWWASHGRLTWAQYQKRSREERPETVTA